MKAVLVMLLLGFFALFHLQGYDEDTLPVGSVEAGDRPSPVRFFDGPGFAYRMSAGQTVSSTYTLPRLKQRWVDRFSDRSSYLYGAVEFRADRSCAPDARIDWRLDDEHGRLPLTHRVRFNALAVDRTPMRLTARLDASTPCTGMLRLRNPLLANVKPYSDSETRSAPSIETIDLSRWGGPSA
ncbi:hypothetical protein [Actinomadura fibrosa]|uniref:Uncharacterized protein n=1 Tax=Actinomadura fibrosa TaxID=111802 RepID=A0ABW2XQI1_9ACTN|nr:hypothetical protein [Actinomadura fibrosa]